MRNKYSPHGGFFHTGSISTGTLRERDLLAAFVDELERLAPFNERKLVHEVREELAHSTETVEPQLASWLLEDLTAALDEVAAAHGHRFGSHEGDGADFGFWPVEEDECV